MAQTMRVTRDSLFSEALAAAQLAELLAMLGYQESQVVKIMNARLRKASRDMEHLSHNAARTTACKKLEEHQQWASSFKAGELDLLFKTLPDPEPAASTARTNKSRSKLAGPYYVAKKPNSSSATGGDAGKWEIWQHVWACNTFEEFFAKAPQKATTSATNRLITPAMEIRWALKQGWIVAGEKPKAEQPASN